MHGLGGEQADAAMAVLVVVPGEELAAEVAGLLDGIEAVRKVGTVLERLEPAFRKCGVQKL